MYTLNLSTGNFIKEREYKAHVKEVKFGVFTSCIGIISLNVNSTISAIHLSILDENNDVFDEDGIKQIASLLSDAIKIFVVGYVDIWKNPRNGVSEKYKTLLTNIANNQPFIEINTDAKSAQFNAKVESGEVIISYDGKY